MSSVDTAHPGATNSCVPAARTRGSLVTASTWRRKPSTFACRELSPPECGTPRCASNAAVSATIEIPTSCTWTWDVYAAGSVNPTVWLQHPGNVVIRRAPARLPAQQYGDVYERDSNRVREIYPLSGRMRIHRPGRRGPALCGNTGQCGTPKC